MDKIAYYYIYALFLLQVLSVGITSVKIGKSEVKLYKFSEFLISFLFAALTGLSLFFLKKGS